MDTFGEWLRQQRNARKLTREEFAKRVGCSAA
jgi:transcriptional regulator with XRE-family HTH domain